MADPDEQHGAAGDQPVGGEQLTQEELRRRLEEQLKKVRVQDMLVESVASILNLSARRIAKEDERDLEQARLGIDAVRALVDMLEPEARSQVQSALSELQMLYARQAGGAPREGGEAVGEGEGGRPAAGGGASGEPGEPGGGRRGSGLWTPPGAA